MTVDTSRSAASSSRSSSMASASAREASPPAAAADSGCGRRVSEKRRTSASVLASRNSERIVHALAAAAPAISGTRCGSEPALRTSTAIATRCVKRSCSRRRNSRSSSGGRLSTQKKPASSSACSATDLPEPEMPVISTTSRVRCRGVPSSAVRGTVRHPAAARARALRARAAAVGRASAAPPSISCGMGAGWCRPAARRRACARPRRRAPRRPPAARR